MQRLEPMAGHGGRRLLCCDFMTIRIQKRDSCVTGRRGQGLPLYPPQYAFQRVRIFGALHEHCRITCTFIRGEEATVAMSNGGIRCENTTNESAA